MNCKRFISGISAFVIAASAFAAMTITASAEYSTDPITGAITWTFNTPAEEAYLTEANTTKCRIYNESLSETLYDTLDAASAAQTETSLVIYNKHGNNVKNYVGKGKLYIRYCNNCKAYYTPKVNGFLYVEGTHLKTDQGNDQTSGTIACTASKRAEIACSENYSEITKVVFTPTTEKGFTFDIKAGEVSGKTLYLKVGDKPETSAVIPETTIFSGEGDVGIAFIISGIPAGLDVSARIE